ncbi:MAG TPA: hypothetical protein PLD25_27665 [Chloroflexota bacterium]|nr:hypothetical protein [Chloroflexota bacterium]
MSKSSPIAVQRKVTVTIPAELLAQLDARIPSRQRSSFITTAIKTQLALVEQQAVLEEAAGAWTENNHPDMVSETDIDHWLNHLRHSWARGGDE